MAQTLTEKILSRTAGAEVRAGDDVEVRPDFILAYVFGGFVKFPRLLVERFGVARLARPDRIALFLDHNRPVVDERLEALTDDVRRWADDQGVAVFDGLGIGHVAACELGFAQPGALLVHFDGHVSQAGAYGALAIGIHLGIYEALARDVVSLRVPETVSVELRGRFSPGVGARDLAHHLIALHRPDFANGAVLEFSGRAVETMTLDQLQELTSLSMFTGAVTALVSPKRTMSGSPADGRRLAIDPVWSDPGADFRTRVHCDLSDVVPMVAAPPSPANVSPLEAHLGLPIDVAYIASCASGRIDDLAAAARILQGRRIADGVKLVVVPSSAAVAKAAAGLGYLSALQSAGAIIGEPGCNVCYGASFPLEDGERAVSTGTLNIPGRMGSADAEIWLASAATVAASALAGRLADPRAWG